MRENILHRYHEPLGISHIFPLNLKTVKERSHRVCMESAVWRDLIMDGQVKSPSQYSALY